MLAKKNFFKRDREVKGDFFVSKRQKFILSVLVLSVGLFSTEFLFNGYGVIVSFFLALCSDLFFFFSMRQKSVEAPSLQAYILPFLYSLSFGLFYFLAPSRLLTRITITSLYAIGLYSLFLTENIFTVASIRTIALLNSARIVSFIIMLVSYFFFCNIIFSFRISIVPTAIILYFVTFFFVLHSIWTYTLEKSLRHDFIWVGILSLCLFELGVVLWFWPTSPTVVAIFLTGVLYILVGLSHVWLDRRLFKGVLWEYVWVAAFAFFILLLFTKWQQV